MTFKIVVLLCSVVHVATSIRCFDCTSVNNSMCLDPSLYDPETLDRFLPTVDCQRGVDAYVPAKNYHFFCRKIHQVIIHKMYEPEVRVLRGCGWNRRMDRDCYTADNEDHLETVCQCFEDRCNAAKGLIADWKLFGVILMVLQVGLLKITIFGC